MFARKKKLRMIRLRQPGAGVCIYIYKYTRCIPSYVNIYIIYISCKYRENGFVLIITFSTIFFRLRQLYYGSSFFFTKNVRRMEAFFFILWFSFFRRLLS